MLVADKAAIRARRLHLGLTHAELAGRMRRSTSLVYKTEHDGKGGLDTFSETVAHQFARALKTSVEKITQAADPPEAASEGDPLAA